MGTSSERATRFMRRHLPERRSGRPRGAARRTDRAADVEVTIDVACGDSDGNLRIDSFQCDTRLIRCGVADRGFLYYATTRPDGRRKPPDRLLHPRRSRQPRVPHHGTTTDHAGHGAARLRAGAAAGVGGGGAAAGRADAGGAGHDLLHRGRGVQRDGHAAGAKRGAGDHAHVVRVEPRDGTGQTTDWPGQAWRRGGSASGYVTHLYEQRMRVSTSVDTTWSARYRVGGGAWEPVPGTVTIDGEASPLRVRSASPRLIGVADHG